MTDVQLIRLKDDYRQIVIPEELDVTLRSAIARGKAGASRSPLRTALIAAAAAICVVTISLNALPGFAAAMSDVPILGRIVEVLTFARFRTPKNSQGYDVNIDVPGVKGLDDTALQDSLNRRYLAEAKEMYDSFMAEVGGLPQGQLAHRALDAGYKVKVNTGELLVIEHWQVKTGASGVETVTYDTLDLRNEVLLSLRGLFKDEGYVETITANIKAQMNAQMAASREVMYFTDPNDPSTFKRLAADQTFYINKDHKLVIVFDEYAVAPGFMGVVEFVIPTDVIAGQLVGNGYIW